MPRPDVVDIQEETPPDEELAEKVEERSKKVKEKYAELDKAGDKVKKTDLKVEGYDFDFWYESDLRLWDAPLAKHPGLNWQSSHLKPIVFLNLLAQKKGEFVERMKVVTGGQARNFP